MMMKMMMKAMIIDFNLRLDEGYVFVLILFSFCMLGPRLEFTFVDNMSCNSRV